MLPMNHCLKVINLSLSKSQNQSHSTFLEHGVAAVPTSVALGHRSADAAKAVTRD